jgi:hypothetical protein
MGDLASLDESVALEKAETLSLEDTADESEERWALVSELHRRGTPTVYEAATRWCASPRVPLRCLGATVLGQLGFADGYPFAERSTVTLIDLLADPDPAVIDSALVALGHLKTGDVHAVCALAVHAAPRVRHSVAFCLGGRNDDLAMQTLQRLSRDEDAGVRDWATFGLGTLSAVDTPALRDALVERLHDSHANVRGEAIRGLAYRKDKRAAHAIIDELARRDGSELAIEAAGEMPQSEFVPFLEAMLAADPDAEHVRLALDVCRASEDSSRR